MPVLTQLISVFAAAKSLCTFTVHSTTSEINQHYIYSATLPGHHNIGRLHISVTPMHVQVLHNLIGNTQNESAARLQMFVRLVLIEHSLPDQG